jgi:cytoskeleton protein RodZ
MKKTGELLKAAREEKGLSLHEVGIFLKINTRILQAIEDGDLTRLPAKTFLRGFIQSYSKYLKLNSEEVLQVFQNELKPAAEISEPVIEVKPEIQETKNHPRQSDESITPAQEVVIQPAKVDSTQAVFIGQRIAGDKLKYNTVLISILSLVLVFIIYFGNNLIQRYKKEAEFPTEIKKLAIAKEVPPSSLLLNEQKTDGELFKEKVSEVSSQPSEKPSLSMKPPIPSPATASSVSAAPVLPKLPVDTTLAKPTVEQPAETATPPVPVVTPSQQVTPNETTSLPTSLNEEAKPVEVIIEANESVEIEYSSAKSTPQKLILKGDQIHTFKSRSGVRLKISNGGAVNVIVNGQDLGAPGASGQSIQLNYE